MSYLRPWLCPIKLQQTLDNLKEVVRDVEFDSIAVQGNSGLLVGAPLAVHLKKNLVIIRKTLESCHSYDLVEGWGRGQNILLVDDFISLGETMDQMHKAINNHCDDPKIKGILLYASVNKPWEKPTFKFKDGSKVPIYYSTV